jgi:hypothetical protein
MNDPSVWTAVLRDPTVPFDRATLWMVVRDQRRWSRRWLYPWLRYVSRATVALIRVAKVLLPARLRAHSTMDRLCVWFLRRFVAPEAGALLLRHFVVETNLLNFVVAHSPGTGLDPVTLRPTTLAQLGNRAVIEHDINVYDVLIGLRRVSRADAVDYSMLDVPPLDSEPGRRRWLNLDIQTALCLMNIPFALCLTSDEYDRAVHSLRLDDSLLTILAGITGDATFLRWRKGGVTVRVDSRVDVPLAVYEHAVICEYAHAQLIESKRAESARLGAGALRTSAFTSA